MLTKLILLVALALVAWKLWQSALSARATRPPPGGFSPAPEQLVRCDRCGVRVPASEVASIRANCRLCGPHAG
jgi:hypothetical protein